MIIFCEGPTGRLLTFRKPSARERRLNETQNGFSDNFNSPLERCGFLHRERGVNEFMTGMGKSVSRMVPTLGSDFHAKWNGKSNFGCALNGVSEMKRLKRAVPKREEV